MSAQSPETDQNDAGVESIADPDNYTTRRWQKQLHDARERVREMKNQVLDRQLEDPRGFNEQIARRNVAEMVADYVLELRPILAQDEFDREEDFLNEPVRAGDTETTLEEFVRRNWFGDEEAPPLRVSMDAWDTCNDYLTDISGPEFESATTTPEDNPVDPANRFNDE